MAKSKSLLSPIEQYVVNIVKEKRTANKWSQKDLAFEMDLSIGFIGDVESNKERAKYSLDHINKLAEIFECSPRDFLPEHFL